MIKDKLYSFIFAGQLKTGKYIEKKTLYDGVVVYKFTDGITTARKWNKSIVQPNVYNFRHF